MTVPMNAATGHSTTAAALMTEPQVKPKTWADHQPDSPFGCEIQWGKKWAETGQFADYRTHICNHSGYRDHAEHVCKCGEQYDAQWDEECEEFGCHDALSEHTADKSDTP